MAVHIPPRRSEGRERTCYVCGETLPEEAFAVDRSKGSGRKSICRACDREKARAYYARPEIRERKLAYMAARKAARR